MLALSKPFLASLVSSLSLARAPWKQMSRILDVVNCFKCPFKMVEFYLISNLGINLSMSISVYYLLVRCFAHGFWQDQKCPQSICWVKMSLWKAIPRGIWGAYFPIYENKVKLVLFFIASPQAWSRRHGGFQYNVNLFVRHNTLTRKRVFFYFFLVQMFKFKFMLRFFSPTLFTRNMCITQHAICPLLTIISIPASKVKIET